MLLLDFTSILSRPAKSSGASHCQAANDWFWWCGQFWGL